ncbi:uncharacterized protein LOC122383215 [Amphibalanus amphitrite]|uniref:uncharacterized protein LOC122383215 n=1 Tax=Amphibalanus amphitrite TaxID=1232801 RepID=UPI001C90F488|nr:uncharacterized protein LOC122383215 [Amphibalanus amphitrite]
MGAERRLLVAAALIALVSAGPLVGTPPAAEQDRSVTHAEPAGAKTAADQPGAATGSEDGTETATGRPAAGGDTQSKIYDGNSSAEAFFTYGAALTGLIYGLMGVSYLYGPYSKEAFLAEQRAELRKKYLERLVGTTEATLEQDYGHYAAEEAAASSGGLFGEIQIPAQYTITRREDEQGYEPGYQPGYEQGHQYRGEDSVSDDRFQLVMARGDPTAVHGVNRRGLEDVIPIRLPEPSAPPTPVVKVLDMRSPNCRAWVACVQDRADRMVQERSELSPTEFDPSCELFVKVCPTKARSLNSITQQ